MKINIILPHREKFDKYKASSVSITVKNNFKHSEYKKNIMIYGQDTENPIFTKNFTGFKNPFLFFLSRNKNIAKKMCKIILSEKDKKQIIEIHNRPYLLNFIYKRLKEYPITLFYHNDPQGMLGSKTIKEREQLLKKAKGIFCVSEYIKSKFLEGLHGDTSKVIVIYNGVERRLKQFPVKNREIIFLGRFVPEKGVHLYVNAISKIANKFPDWKFRLIGSTYLGSSKKQTSYALKVIKDFRNIGGQAILEGFISSRAAQKKMETASIIVIPSIWNEPYGLVVAEAMSNGVAIITSNVGGIPEIIKDNGLIISEISEDKIEMALLSLLNSPKNLKKFQKLSWDNFNHSSVSSSQKLDHYRKRLILTSEL